MSEYLYIPTSSLNFNNVFSTESISPPVFYARRNFGTKRYYSSNTNSMEDFVLLYSEIPLMELSPDLDEYPFYIRLLKDEIKEELIEIFDNQDIKIYACPQTIYLNLYSPAFLFSTEENKQTIIAKSLSSIEVKTINKYTNSFLCGSFEKTYSLTGKEKFLKITNKEMDKHLSHDKTVNHFKGLLYGYLIGKMFPKSATEIELKKTIRNVANYWGSLKSEIGVIKHRKNSTFKANDKFESSGDKLKQSLVDLKKHLTVIFIERNKDSILLDYLATKGIEDSTIFVETTKKIPELFNYLLRLSQSKQSVLQMVIKMEECIDSYIKFSDPAIKFSSRLKQTNDERIKTLIFDIEKECSQKFFDESKSATLPQLSDISYSGQKISFSKEKRVGSELADIKMYELILNIIFQNSKSAVGELSVEEKLDLLILIGNKIKDEYGDDSVERKYLLDFYGFISNKSEGFTIHKASHSSLANLTAFLMKPDSMEQMTNYMEINYVKNMYMGCSYWSAFNGFCALGKTFTRNFFDAGNTEWTSRTDNFFKRIYVKDYIEAEIPVSILREEKKSYTKGNKEAEIPVTIERKEEKKSDDKEKKKPEIPVTIERKGEKKSEPLTVVLDTNVILQAASANPFTLVEKDKELAAFLAWIKHCYSSIENIIQFDDKKVKDVNDFKFELLRLLTTKGKEKPAKFTKKIAERAVSKVDYKPLMAAK